MYCQRIKWPLRFFVSMWVGVALLGATNDAQALYIQQQLEQTPIDRLVDNLAAQVEAKPKDAKLRHNLARVHAMAYASKSETAPTVKGRGQTGVWFGYEPRHVPFVNKPTDDPEKLKAAKEHLGKAIERYKEVLKLNPDDLTAQLGYAWCLDQADRDMQAIGEYRKIIKKGWEKESKLRGAPLGGHFIVAEALKYLKPHLDVKRDADEIALIVDRIATLRRLPRFVTPIVIPLEDGLTAMELHNRNAKVLFDADGTGRVQRWTWAHPNAAWLVYDREQTGRITSAIQMFGSVSFWCFWDNGYQALSALDNNGDGQLAGSEINGLALWHDVNSNGISEPGEVRSLAEHNIVSLSCVWQTDAAHPKHIAMSPQGVTFRDGTVRPSFDLILHSQDVEK